MDNNTISVELTNKNEFLLAAHNSNKDAHQNIVQEIMEKINMLNSTIYELKDNMEAMSDIPSKLSELQNDTNFVSEQTLINAINTRGLINEEQLNKIVKTLEESLKSYVKTVATTAKAECKGYCEDSIKILTAKIEELEDDILNLAPENSNTNMQDSSL